ncbi:TonB-dependent receptor for ferrichrome transport [Pseudohongiella spirulinae]|uniref:TonB-dependent receptor for ferrichrome transport n=2 Tax=Pseudohongiella spirulinae TaxID=1249552 RepID=A0A0S2KGT3_9GAMM|nr:TonB-dependent receptor for ferrichrome transport [Pseudohongiella spirulinae]
MWRFMTSPLPVRLLSASLAVTGLTLASPALIAQSAAEIEEIIVSTQRQAYRGDFTALETPQSIQVLNVELMEQAGVTDLNQALDLSAAVARQNNFGGLWNSFAVRGFAGDENLPSNYLVNGFNAGRGFGGSRDISGIQAVEVLKGPMAALFGRGEPGGAINLVTKRPTGVSAGQLRAGLDEFGTVRTDLDYSSNVIGDRAAFRLVGFRENGESFRDTVDWQAYGFTPSVIVQLAESTTLVYELETSRNKVPFDRGVVAVNGELGLIPPSRFLGEPGDGPMDAQVTGHQIELNQELNTSWNLLLGYNYRDTSLTGFSTEPELTGSRQRLDRDGRNLTRQRRLRNYDAEYQVIRAELNGQIELGGLSHRLIVGIDSDRFDNDQIFRRYRAPVLGSGTTLEQSLAIDIFNPVYGQFALPAPTPLTDRLEVLKATGIYVQDQINLTDALQIRVGLRFDDFSQRTDNRLNGRSSRQSDSRFSPQLGAVYMLGNQVSLYGTYGQGFRANSGTDVSGNSFAANESSSTEVGVKFELLNGGLQGNVALFRQNQENMLSGDAQNPGFSVAVGEARSRGLEFDLAGSHEGYDLHFSYAYVDAEATKGVLDFNFGRQISAGDKLINVPRHSLSAMISRDLTLDGRAVTFGGGVIYVGERAGETATSFMLPGYAVWRAYTAVELINNFNIKAELDNVFDKTYYSNSFSPLWIQPGTPRRARISAELRF